MNTATFAGRKTRSAVRRRSGNGLAATRYRSPFACTSRRMSRSGCVSRLRIACMFLLRAAEEAHEPSGGLQSVGSGTVLTPESSWHFNSGFIEPGRVDRPEANVGYRLSRGAGGRDECGCQYHLGRIDTAAGHEPRGVAEIRVDHRIEEHSSTARPVQLGREGVVIAERVQARDPLSGLAVGHARDAVEHASGVPLALYECDGRGSEDAGRHACRSGGLGKDQRPVGGCAARVTGVLEIRQVWSEEVWAAPGQTAHDAEKLSVAEDRCLGWIAGIAATVIVGESDKYSEVLT